MEPVTGIPVDVTTTISQVNNIIKKINLIKNLFKGTLEFEYDEDGQLIGTYDEE